MSMAFRQSNSHTRTGSNARTIELQIDMGQGVPSPTTTYDSNYLPNTRRTIYPKQSTNLPDWTGPTPTPAPFSLKCTFSTPFVYVNKSPLVWDLMVTKNSSTGQYYVDWFPSPPAVTRGTTPQELGKGCTTGNGVFQHASNFHADASNLMLDWSATNAPSSAPALAALGIRDPNLAVGWCANVRTDALVLLPAAAANSAGTITGSLKAPWQDVFAGITLYTQIAATDTSQPNGIALSNGLMGSTPFAKGGGTGASMGVYGIYNQRALGPTGTAYINAIPVEFGVR